MKKFLLIGLVILFLSGCSREIIQFNFIEGKGRIYKCNTFYYGLPQVKKQFPNYILIEKDAYFWIIYTTDGNN